MQLAIVHLSDVHFLSEPSSDPLIGRADKLQAAIQRRIAGQDACLIIACGDSAYSGRSQEYKIAVPFFRDLVCGLKNACGGKPIALAVVPPGNHD